MEKSVRLTAINKLFPQAHILKAKGSPQQNKTYCTKDKTRIKEPVEYGELPIQGRRTDLNLLKEDLKKHMPIADVADKHFSNFLRYEKSINRFRMFCMPEPREKDITYLNLDNLPANWLNEAHQQGGYYVDEETRFFDGYSDEATIIIRCSSDYSKPNHPLPKYYTNVNTIISPNPVRAEIKGGYTWLNPSNVFLVYRE